LLRPLDEKKSGDLMLHKLENKILKEANSLGIGPMGLGGRTTLLGVKIASRTRVPASFFVTVAYLCWACRRRSISL
jgi:fumarate hydratase class I